MQNVTDYKKIMPSGSISKKFSIGNTVGRGSIEGKERAILNDELQRVGFYKHPVWLLSLGTLLFFIFLVAGQALFFQEDLKIDLNSYLINEGLPDKVATVFGEKKLKFFLDCNEVHFSLMNIPEEYYEKLLQIQEELHFQSVTNIWEFIESKPLLVAIVLYLCLNNRPRLALCATYVFNIEIGCVYTFLNFQYSLVQSIIVIGAMVAFPEFLWIHFFLRFARENYIMTYLLTLTLFINYFDRKNKWAGIPSIMQLLGIVIMIFLSYLLSPYMYYLSFFGMALHPLEAILTLFWVAYDCEKQMLSGARFLP